MFINHLTSAQKSDELVHYSEERGSLFPSPLRDDLLRLRLADIAIWTLKTLAEDNYTRMQSYRQELKILQEGVFYPNDYYEALKQRGQIKRLDWLKEKGCFYHGLAPKEFFELVEDPQSPTGFKVGSLALKNGKKPSEALNAFQKGLTFLDCGGACQFGYYRAIESVLGKEKFDVLFAADSVTPLRLGYNDPKNPIQLLMQAVYPGFDQIRKGQIVYIRNSDYYPIKHVNGEIGGFNMFCCEDLTNIRKGQERFVALGLPPQGMNIEQIKAILHQEYNKDSLGMQMVTQEVARKIFNSHSNPTQYELVLNSLKDHKLSLVEFQSSNGGYIAPLVMDLNVERIAQLANHSIQEAGKLLAQWKKNS
jgi:hypothetical protein